MIAALARRPRTTGLGVAAVVAALTAGVAVTAPDWTPVVAGAALLGAGFAVMAPCELQMAAVLATVVGRSQRRGAPGVRGAALRFAAGYLLFYAPVAIVLGVVAQLLGGTAWAVAAAGGVLAVLLGLAALGDGGPAWLRRCRGPLYLLRSGRASFAHPLRAGAAFGQYCSTCCGPYVFALVVFAGATRDGRVAAGLVAAYAVLMALPFLVPALVAPARWGALTDRVALLRPALDRGAGLSLVAVGALVIPASIAAGLAT